MNSNINQCLPILTAIKMELSAMMTLLNPVEQKSIIVKLYISDKKFLIHKSSKFVERNVAGCP